MLRPAYFPTERLHPPTSKKNHAATASNRFASMDWAAIFGTLSLAFFAVVFTPQLYTNWYVRISH